MAVTYVTHTLRSIRHPYGEAHVSDRDTYVSEVREREREREKELIFCPCSYVCVCTCDSPRAFLFCIVLVTIEAICFQFAFNALFHSPCVFTMCSSVITRLYNYYYVPV